jgi:type II secretory pathway predicted ATPase ExeA
VRALDGDTATFHHLWLAASSLPNDPGPGQTAAPRIAGRRDELATVRHHLETSTGLLLITGEAGIGKSALMATACQEAESWILTGHCLPLSTQIPLLPVVEALRNLHEEDDGEVLRGVLRACPAYVKNSLTRLLPALADSGHLDGPDHQWSHQQLFAAIRTVLEVLQRQRSTALVIEDLHWADTDTLDLLEQVTHTSPVTVVGTWRLHDPEVPARHRDWLARAQRRATSIELQPLSLDDSILQLRLLRSDITDDQARLIHERSQGQPLFTEQLLDAPGPSSSSPLLDDLLDRRIAPVRRRAWLVASVLGVADRPLVDGTLRGATGLGRVQLAKSLQELREHGCSTSPVTPTTCLTRCSRRRLRRRLLPGETADVHQRLARAMSAHPGPNRPRVALHWQHANEPTEELIWRIRAARAASQRYAASQAADHWLRALDLWPAGSPTAGVPPIRRYHAIAGAVSQLEAAGRPTEEAAVLEPALEAPEEFEVMERADLLHLSARANSTQPLTLLELAFSSSISRSSCSARCRRLAAWPWPCVGNRSSWNGTGGATRQLLRSLKLPALRRRSRTSRWSAQSAPIAPGSSPSRATKAPSARSRPSTRRSRAEPTWYRTCRSRSATPTFCSWRVAPPPTSKRLPGVSSAAPSRVP